MEFSKIDDYLTANVYNFFPPRENNNEYTFQQLLGGTGLNYKFICMRTANNDILTCEHLYNSVSMSDVYSYSTLLYTIDKMDNNNH